MESQGQECAAIRELAHVRPGACIKQGNPEPHVLHRSPEQLCPARPSLAQAPAVALGQAHSAMISCHSLPFLLLLPLGACFPVLDRDAPVNAMDVVGGGRSWANLAGGRHFLWGSPGWQRAPHPGAWLIMAKELQAAGRARASFGLRFGRQDDGSEAAGFLPGDGEKASGLLGTLAEELHGYSRKKGGFSFRFGRG